MLPHCSIGAAVTRRIASECGRAVIADLDAEAGAALVAEVGADRAHFVHCDVKSALHTHMHHLRLSARVPLCDLINHPAACGREQHPIHLQVRGQHRRGLRCSNRAFWCAARSGACRRYRQPIAQDAAERHCGTGV